MEENLNHHTDPSGQVASARTAAGPQYLGDIVFVEQLVRHFVNGILDRFDLVGRGSLMSTDAVDADKRACQHMAFVFSGLDPAFTPITGWNGAGLAEHLRETMSSDLPESEDDTDLIANAFAVLVHVIYDTLRRFEEYDDLVFLKSLEREAQSFAHRLVGVA